MMLCVWGGGLLKLIQKPLFREQSDGQRAWCIIYLQGECSIASGQINCAGTYGNTKTVIVSQCLLTLRCAANRVKLYTYVARRTQE